MVCMSEMYVWTYSRRRIATLIRSRAASAAQSARRRASTAAMSTSAAMWTSMAMLTSMRSRSGRGTSSRGRSTRARATVEGPERRGRPRKEVHRGDAEGVRKHLAALSIKFPEMMRAEDGSEAVVPRAVEEEVEEEEAAEEAAEEAKRAATRAAARVSLAASRVGTRRSVESRKKIGAAQRERWKNARLAAGASATTSFGDVSEAAPLTAQQRKDKAAKERTAKLTKLIAMKKSTSRAEKIASSSVKVNQFSYELSAYTRLREELASWSDGFEQAKGRRPNFKDVQKTRIPWLIESFKEYVRLRNKLISETPKIRGEVGKLAKQTLPTPRSLPLGELRLSIDDDNDDVGGDDEKKDDNSFSVFNFTR